MVEDAAKPDSRCTGHCCKDFTLPYGPGELATEFAAWQGGEHFRILEIEVLYPMLVWLGFTADAPEVRVDTDGVLRHHYTCRNLDEAGNCQIYATRPMMCQDFPYGRACPYRGCTWEDGATATSSEKKQFRISDLYQISKHSEESNHE